MRAHTALMGLAPAFVSETRTALDQMRRVLEFAPDDAAVPAMAELQSFAHEIRGQAGSLGYGLLTDVATSLSALLAEPRNPDLDLHSAVGAHLDAMATILDTPVRGDGGRRGRAVLARLHDVSAAS